MRILLVFSMLGALALGGCATVNPNVATPSQEYIGLNAYDAAVKTAKNYLRLPLCPAAALCRTQSLSQSVHTAMRVARTAKAQIVTALEANQQLPLTAIQALEAAYAVIQQIPK